MVERQAETIGIPQLTRATVETFPLWIKNKETLMPSASLTLAQLRAVFPEQTNNVLQSSQAETLRLFTYFMHLGISMNDWLDCNSDEQKSALKEWKFINHRLTSEHSPSGKALALHYQRETLITELHFKKNPPQDPNKACLYREIVNAIALLHISSLILGTDTTGVYKDEGKTVDTLFQKYSWLLGGNPQSNEQSKLVGLFNTVMAIQVIDDHLDYARDSKMGITSIATVIAQNKGEYEIDHTCKSIKRHYSSRAQQFGISKNVIYLNNTIFASMKKLMEWKPETFGGRREQAINLRALSQR